jgi:hypothetical protein
MTDEELHVLRNLHVVNRKVNGYIREIQRFAAGVA